MRKYLVSEVVLPVFLIWGASFPTMAASNNSQQNTGSEASNNSGAACQVSDAVLAVIRSAEASVNKAGKSNVDARKLVQQAKNAARPPNCDGATATMLADQATQLVEEDTESMEQDAESTDTKKIGNQSGSSTRGTNTTVTDGCWGSFHSTEENTTEGWVLGSLSSSTTTTTFGLGITSGTCDTSSDYSELQQYRFVAVAQDNLAKDIARGSGEYITTMAYLEGCPIESHDNFARMAQRNFSSIFSEAKSDPEAILFNLENQIAADPLLRAQCSRVS